LPSYHNDKNNYGCKLNLPQDTAFQRILRKQRTGILKQINC